MRHAPIVTLVLLVAACGGGPGSASPTATPRADGTPAGPSPGVPSGVPAPTGGPVMSDPPMSEDVAAVVDAARDDLAARLETDPQQLAIVQATAVTWPDGSLGCPRPGEMYTQALVEGYQVILEHDGRVYDYHAGSDGPPFLCASDERDGGREFVPPPGFDT